MLPLTCNVRNASFLTDSEKLNFAQIGTRELILWHPLYRTASCITNFYIIIASRDVYIYVWQIKIELRRYRRNTRFTRTRKTSITMIPNKMERVNTRRMLHRKVCPIFFPLWTTKRTFYPGKGKFNSRLNPVSEECAWGFAHYVYTLCICNRKFILCKRIRQIANGDYIQTHPVLQSPRKHRVIKVLYGSCVLQVKSCLSVHTRRYKTKEEKLHCRKFELLVEQRKRWKEKYCKSVCNF